MSTIYVNTISPQTGSTVEITDTVNLGDTAADVITTVGQLTASEGLTSTKAAFFNANVTLGNAGVDVTTATGQLTASQGILVDDDKYLYFGAGADSKIYYKEAADDYLHISGSLKGTVLSGSNVIVNDLFTLGSRGIVYTTPALVPDSTTALTHNANGGRTNVIPDTGGDRVWTLPTPTAAGQHFHFIYGGAAIEAHDNYIKTVTDDDSVFFKGAIFHHSLNAMAPSAAKYSNGSSNSSLKIDNAAYLDLHFLSYSTTVWYIWGMVVSDTAPTFEDQGD